ncbi:MAG: hypothetical protein ABIN91_21630 [Mucilaginibacter sp.]|uniref:hypothetical protein n=1 Tax=Mucilaginibacter sp. TaxID=1882438 RepID=UPI003267B163
MLKKAFRKSLILTVLVLSFLSFSATAVSNQTKQVATQSEWVLGLKAGQIKGVSYKQACTKFERPVLTGLFDNNSILSLSHLHTKQARIGIVLHARIAIHNTFTRVYMRLTTIPTENDSDRILILS